MKIDVAQNSCPEFIKGAHRSGETSPPFPGLDKKLQHGQKIDAEEFPAFWSA